MSTMSNDDPRVPDGVISIAARRDRGTWEWCGSVQVRAGDVVHAAFLDVVGLDKKGLRARLCGQDDVLQAVEAKRTIDIFPDADSGANWGLHDVQVVSNRQFDVAAHVELLIPEGSVPVGPLSRARLHRITYRPLALPRHRYQMWRGDERGTHAQFFNAFTVFDRVFAITRVRGEDRDANVLPLLSLAWEGDALTEMQLDALEMALFLMGGRGARPVSAEQYDANACYISANGNYGTFSLSSYPTYIFPPERFATESSQRWIPALVECLHAAFATGVPLRPILYHFFSSQIHDPELAMLFLGTTREAMLPQPGELDTTLFKLCEFRARAAPAVDILRERFADLDGNDLRTLLSRLEGLNDVSVSRRRKMLGERTGVVPDENELRVLRHRDVVAHAGYILV